MPRYCFCPALDANLASGERGTEGNMRRTYARGEKEEFRREGTHGDENEKVRAGTRVMLHRSCSHTHTH